MGFVPINRGLKVITVYSYDGKIAEGTVLDTYSDKSYAFRGLVNLLFLIEELEDRCGNTEKFMEDRSIAHDIRTNVKPIEAKKRDDVPLATFGVRILFRQNASWQGQILWNDRKREACFRSVCELIKLMDDMLCGK